MVFKLWRARAFYFPKITFGKTVIMTTTIAKNLLALFLIFMTFTANAEDINELIFFSGFEPCDNAETAPDGAVFWDGGGDGTSWNDELNWEGDALPAENDDVWITENSSKEIIKIC